MIIPVRNEATALPATLHRLLHPRFALRDIEVIIVDGGSHDNSVEIARSFGCRTFASSCGRAKQMNFGARYAKAPFLWFLHADTLPPDNWPRVLENAARDCVAATFPLRFDYRHPLSPLRLYGWLSGFDVDAFRFGDQSLFVARNAFQRVGGFDERMNLLEDNDLVRRLRRQVGRIKLLPGHVVTSARRYRRHGVFFTQAVYVGIYLAYRAGVGNARLLRWYRRAFG